MKRRVRKIANFFAFNLLFFALYLNFVHRDKAVAAGAPAATTGAFGTSVIVSNNTSAVSKKQETDMAVVKKEEKTVSRAENNALRLSIN